MFAVEISKEVPCSTITGNQKTCAKPTKKGILSPANISLLGMWIFQPICEECFKKTAAHYGIEIQNAKQEPNPLEEIADTLKILAENSNQTNKLLGQIANQMKTTQFR